jgi:hypothetical protein
MNVETSVKLVDSYAQSRGISACEALIELDHLCFEDWKHTLKGAPKNYVPQTTKTHHDAVRTFCKGRQKWRSEALKQGVDISDFRP